jgi:hypothetical protein
VSSRTIRRVVGVLAVAALACPAAAGAHPEEEAATPWTAGPDDILATTFLSGNEPGTGHSVPSPPGIAGLTHVGNADKDGTVNSDLAFWGTLAYAGNYSGFRILDINGDRPRVLADMACNGPQNDVSVYELGGRRFLFQSIDTAQTAEDCTSRNAPFVKQGRVGYEGIRVFDVTNPRKPAFVDMVQTACGSHTHTLVPDGDRAFIYVSSYPLGSGVTGTNVTGPGDFRPCASPHRKVSIVEATAPDGDFSYRLKEQPLSEDTTAYHGFQACHDIQAFMARSIAVASCAGDAQLWDISDPWNPTSDVEGRHTHIEQSGSGDNFEFIHSGIVSWDGDVFAVMDETGGGVTSECFGAASHDGFYYFYDLVPPGSAAPPLLGRYTIPRSQGSETCVSHNASVVPVAGRDVMTAAYYQGGVTLVDFTDPAAPREIAFADLVDATGAADEWSSYWYNGRVFSNSGLNRRGASANRGLDVYRPAGSLGLAGAKAWAYSNPQTQEAWQAP